MKRLKRPAVTKKSRGSKPVVEFLIDVDAPIPKKQIRSLCEDLFTRFAKKRIVKRTRSQIAGQADLMLIFLRRKRARDLNRTYRKKDYATDVLSFSPKARGVGLGELVFCEPVIRKQAKEHGLTFKDELIYLAIHGFLHLLGYDHETRKQERVMMGIQDRLFEEFTS